MFFIQENVAFNLSVTQSISTGNEQNNDENLNNYIQIVCTPLKKLVKK